MKASEYGGKVPADVGGCVYAFSEDGEGDGLFHNTAASEDAAIEGLIDDFDGEVMPEPGEHLGYIGDLVEAYVTPPDAGGMIDEIVSNMKNRHGELTNDFLDCDAAQLKELEDEIEKVFGGWMTRNGLWPKCPSIKNVRAVMMRCKKGGEK